VGDGDRAEEPARVARAAGQPHIERLDLGLQLLGVAQAAHLAGLAGLADRLDLLLGALAPRDRETARQQVVAAVAVLDLDHVAGGAEVGDLVREDELHCYSALPSARCWCTAATPSRGCSSRPWRRRA